MTMRVCYQLFVVEQKNHSKDDIRKIKVENSDYCRLRQLVLVEVFPSLSKLTTDNLIFRQLWFMRFVLMGLQSTFFPTTTKKSNVGPR